MSILPNEYQPVEYIQSAGEQYINTGYIPNYNTRVELEFQITSIPNKPMYILGSSTSFTNGFNLNFDSSNPTSNKFRNAFGNVSRDSNTMPEINTIYNILIDKTKIDINNDKTWIAGGTTNFYDGNLFLFTDNRNGTAFTNYSFIGKMYKCKIYDNNTLIHNYIPCYRKSNNEIGLYDLITKAFLTNQGSGSFAKGKDIDGTVAAKLSYLRETEQTITNKSANIFGDEVENATFREVANKYKTLYNEWEKVTDEGTEITLTNTKKGRMEIGLKGNTSQETLPDGYTALTYIEGTGEQYIDTGIYGNLNTKIEIKAEKSSVTQATKQLFGSYEEGGNSITINIGPGNATRFGSKYFSLNAYNWITAGVSFIISTNKNIMKINEQNVGTFNEINEFTTETTMYLMSANGSSSKWDGKLYYCKIYDNDILVREFMPCKNNNNEVGLYDLVTKTFYGNQGTGTFIAGDETSFPNPEYPQDIKVVTGNNKVIVEGVNKFNHYDYPVTQVTDFGITVTNNGDGSFTLNGTCTQDNRGVKLGTSTNIKNLVSNNIVTHTLYYLSGTNTKVSTSNNRNVLRLNYNQSLSFIRLAELENAGSISKTQPKFTSDVGWDWSIICGQGDTFDNFTVKYQLEIGDAATDYEPYIQPIEKELDLTGKNLIDINNFQNNQNRTNYTVNQNTIIMVANSSGTYRYIYCNIDNLEIGKKYTISIGDFNDTSINKIAQWGITKSSGNYYGYARTLKDVSSITFTPTEVTVQVRLGYFSNNCEANDELTISNLQLEKGSTATSYEPYYNYELAGKGEYKDLIFKNEKINPNYNAELDEDEWYLKKNIEKINSYNGETINTDYISTTGGLDTGATIYYGITNPTYTKITETTLINQLEDLYHAQSNDNTTIITQTNADLPFVLNVSALKKEVA